jgi:hypothetical protein
MPHPAAQRIIDLLIDHFQQDERFPRMSRMAWTVKLQTLERQIGDIVDDARSEERADVTRELTLYRE